MNDHTFPISEDAARQLDQVRVASQRELQESVRGADRWVRENATLAAGIALMVGIIVGGVLRNAK